MNDLDFVEFMRGIPYIIKDEDFREAARRWGGFHGRSEMVIEECSELIQAIMHERRENKPDTKRDVLEEACDVLLTVFNLIQVINDPDTTRIMEQKYAKFTAKLHRNFDGE